MAGNVWEWCQDWYDSDRDTKMLRGGGWRSNANHLRVAYDLTRNPDNRFANLGFRCVVSESDFTSGASAGGDFTSDEGAPLPLAGNQGVIEWEKDGSLMALIPSGFFEMGDSKNEPGDWMKRSRPVHRVELDAFYMDVREVTVGQFREFVNQSGYSYNKWNDVAKYSLGDEYPIVEMSWNDATAYAKWAGKRLPTEAEWEYAARGGLVGKRYSWGDEKPDGSQCNFADKNTNYNWSDKTVDDGYKYTAPVGSFIVNGYGLYDMAGNVWEWCQDWYSSDYYSNSPTKNLLFSPPEKRPIVVWPPKAQF